MFGISIHSAISPKQKADCWKQINSGINYSSVVMG